MSDMTTQRILERLRSELGIILGRQFGAEIDSRPLHEIGVDSISLVELLVMIEREFNLPLMDAGLSADDFRTLERLAGVIHDRQE